MPLVLNTACSHQPCCCRGSLVSSVLLGLSDWWWPMQGSWESKSSACSLSLWESTASLGWNSPSIGRGLGCRWTKRTINVGESCLGVWVCMCTHMCVWMFVFSILETFISIGCLFDFMMKVNQESRIDFYKVCFFVERADTHISKVPVLLLGHI